MTFPLHLAFRTLSRTPGFALTAVAALALGIGANTAIFSLVDQVLLNPPGVSDPARVVAIRVHYYKLNLQSIGVSVPDFEDVHRSRNVFERAALMGSGDFNYTGGNVPRRLQGASVSAEWFDVFGARPRLGRVFRREEDRPNANNVVVLAYGAWVRLFGRDPGVLGRVIPLNQKPYRVIGVMGPDFRWPQQADLWVPLGLADSEYAEDNRFNEGYSAFARIRPGTPFARANALVRLLGARLRSGSTRGAAYARDSAWGMFALPMTDYTAGATKQPLLILSGAVAFVLLIACSNIAGLMIARTAGRAREIAVRAALGAGRWQLLRGTVQESFLLAGGGAITGLALAWAAMRVMLLIAPADAVAGLEARLDPRILFFTMAISIVSGLVFGIAPVWQIARTDPNERLRGGNRGSTAGPGRQRLRSTLVIGETALAIVLLVGAGLFLRSFARVEQVNPGFDPHNVMVAALSLPESRYRTDEQRIAFYREIRDRLAALPGVSAAGLGVPTPFSGMDASASFSVEGRVAGPGDPGPHGDIRYVTPGYLEALRVPLRTGRFFTDQDRLGAAPVAIIDENLARQYWPNQNPVGRHLRNGTRAPWATIVGVVGHVKHSDLAADSGKGVYYYSMLQSVAPFTGIAVRAAADPTLLSEAIARTIRDVDPSQPVYNVHTLEDVVSASLAPRRFIIRIMGFFAITALLLCALGLYGVVAYSVSERTQELGLRMALGAQRPAVLALILGQGFRLAAIGAVAGLITAAGLGWLVRSQLFGVSAFDVVTLSVAPVILIATALLASYIPARRATKVDPITALRYE